VEDFLIVATIIGGLLIAAFVVRLVTVFL